MDYEKIISHLNNLENQIREQNDKIKKLQETNELEKELYLSKIKILESELELLKEGSLFKENNELNFNKPNLYEILEQLDTDDPYYKEIIKDFSELYISNIINEKNKSFKVKNAFEPVSAWTDSFKKSDKWKKLYKWVLPNAMMGAIIIDTMPNNTLGGNE